MINGIHALLYSRQAEALRAFFRDVLQFPHVDAGHGWLIFALPPAELGIHPTMQTEESGEATTELYLMCDNLEATMKELEAKGVRFTQEVTDAGFGLVTAIELPDGSELGLYEPKHPVALGLGGR